MAQPQEEEQVRYKIKRVDFLNRRNVPIVLQNENGPCPLLAISNVLLLRKSISIHPDLPEIALSDLLSLVAHRLLDSNESSEGKDEDYLINQQQNVSDVISMLPRLATGIDVNVRFRNIHDFEFTPEIAIFDLLDIDLVHGWLVDPQDEATVKAVGSQSYNSLVENLVALQAAHPDIAVKLLHAQGGSSSPTASPSASASSPAPPPPAAPPASPPPPPPPAAAAAGGGGGGGASVADAATAGQAAAGAQGEEASAHVSYSHAAPAPAPDPSPGSSSVVGSAAAGDSSSSSVPLGSGPPSGQGQLHPRPPVPQQEEMAAAREVTAGLAGLSVAPISVAKPADLQHSLLAASDGQLTPTFASSSSAPRRPADPAPAAAAAAAASAAQNREPFGSMDSHSLEALRMRARRGEGWGEGGEQRREERELEQALALSLEDNARGGAGAGGDLLGNEAPLGGRGGSRQGAAPGGAGGHVPGGDKSGGGGGSLDRRESLDRGTAGSPASVAATDGGSSASGWVNIALRDRGADMAGDPLGGGAGGDEKLGGMFDFSADDHFLDEDTPDEDEDGEEDAQELEEEEKAKGDVQPSLRMWLEEGQTMADHLKYGSVSGVDYLASLAEAEADADGDGGEGEGGDGDEDEEDEPPRPSLANIGRSPSYRRAPPPDWSDEDDMGGDDASTQSEGSGSDDGENTLGGVGRSTSFRPAQDDEGGDEDEEEGGGAGRLVRGFPPPPAPEAGDGSEAEEGSALSALERAAENAVSAADSSAANSAAETESKSASKSANDNAPVPDAGGAGLSADGLLVARDGSGGEEPGVEKAAAAAGKDDAAGGGSVRQEVQQDEKEQEQEKERDANANASASSHEEEEELSESVKAGMLVYDFLKESASQLTYHGLFSLQAGLKERELSVFFRNNHFSTIFKYEGNLYLLATDQGYYSQPNLVWEKLTEVEGDNQFTTGDFQAFTADSVPASWRDEHHAALSAAAAAAGASSRGPGQGAGSYSSDHELAMALQQQEYDSQSTRRQVDAAGAASAGPPRQTTATSAGPGGQGRPPAGMSPMQMQQQSSAAGALQRRLVTGPVTPSRAGDKSEEKKARDSCSLM